jgi:hypothetical protein
MQLHCESIKVTNVQWTKVCVEGIATSFRLRRSTQVGGLWDRLRQGLVLGHFVISKIACVMFCGRRGVRERCRCIGRMSVRGEIETVYCDVS